MMDLVRLSRRPLFPPGGVDLYRQIAILTDMGEGDEVLDAACGNAVPLEWFVTEFGVHLDVQRFLLGFFVHERSFQVQILFQQF